MDRTTVRASWLKTGSWVALGLMIALPLIAGVARLVTDEAPSQTETASTTALAAAPEAVSSMTQTPVAAAESILTATPMIESATQVSAIDPSKENATMEKAMFGAGCFWGVEATFREVKGVVDAAVGYSGGETINPTYKEVCTDRTGHAEVVQVIYDPAVVSYDELLNVFWNNHNPTTLNQQGPDFGSQYRSAIFFYTPEQEIAAKKSLDALQQTPKYLKRKIVTEISPAQEFYRAEEYHQRYLEKRGMAKCHN